jgi:hypothetical protein
MTVGHRQPGPSSPATTSERPSPSLGTLGPKAAILALHLSVTESRSVDGAISLHTAGRLAEAHRANELVGRTCALLLAGWRVGTEYVLENPADHQTMATSRVHDSSSTRCTDYPMWLLAEVIALKKLTSAEECTLFPCACSAPNGRRRTTLLFSAGFSRWLRPLADLKCNHQTHEKQVGGVRPDAAGAPTERQSAEAAAYPTQFNWFLTAMACHRVSLTPLAAPAEAPFAATPPPVVRLPARRRCLPCRCRSDSLFDHALRVHAYA